VNEKDWLVYQRLIIESEIQHNGSEFLNPRKDINLDLKINLLLEVQVPLNIHLLKLNEEGRIIDIASLSFQVIKKLMIRPEKN